MLKKEEKRVNYVYNALFGGRLSVDRPTSKKLKECILLEENQDALNALTALVSEYCWLMPIGRRYTISAFIETLKLREYDGSIFAKKYGDTLVQLCEG